MANRFRWCLLNRGLGRLSLAGLVSVMFNHNERVSLKAYVDALFLARDRAVELAEKEAAKRGVTTTNLLTLLIALAALIMSIANFLRAETIVPHL